MRKIIYSLALMAILGLLAGCAGQQPSKPKVQISSIAVVSLAVNNYGHFGSQGAISSELLKESVNVMLTQTEELLAQKWTVKPAKSFVGDSAYRNLSIGDVKADLFAPILDNKVMPSFTDNRKEIIRGVLKPETAKSLCATLGVDAVVLVYSEWMIDSGKFIPVIKALTKNCFAMYSKDGSKVFFERKDVRGTNVIGGAFAGVHINKDTIDQWTNAYASGAEAVFKRHM